MRVCDLGKIQVPEIKNKNSYILRQSGLYPRPLQWIDATGNYLHDIKKKLQIIKLLARNARRILLTELLTDSSAARQICWNGLLIGCRHDPGNIFTTLTVRYRDDTSSVCI